MLWQRGGVPRSFLAENEAKSLEWRKQYVATYLERDIPSLGLNIPSLQLRRFWLMLTHYHGQILNAHALANALDISAPTVKRYLDILAGTFMIRLLPPWRENIAKRQVKSPKVYFRDSGLFHTLAGIESTEALYLSPHRGASWEGFALEETIRQLGARPEECFFWATHQGAELDLLIFKNGKRMGFEMKHTDTPKYTPSIRQAILTLGLDRITLVYPGQKRFWLDEKVEAVGFGTNHWQV